MRFRMTASDYEVLHTVAECRLVTIPQLAALLSRNGKSLSQRIGQLAAEGLLANAPRGPGQRRGRPERVVSPAAGGAAFLQERGLIDSHASPEEILGERVPPQAHQLLLNWVRAHLHHAETVAPHLKIRFFAHNSPFLPAEYSSISIAADPLPDGAVPQKNVSFKPDATFSISDATQGKTVLFFLEVDRGTEIVGSPKRTRKDIRQKILNYGMCFDMQAYKKYESLWNCKLNGFRLLFVTDIVARLSTLSALVREMPPSDFIWLTEQARMFKEGISAPIWVRGGRLDAPPHSIFGRWSCQAPLP